MVSEKTIGWTPETVFQLCGSPESSDNLQQAFTALQKQAEAYGDSAHMKDQERDVLLRKTVLELIKKDHVHYMDIEKKACASCLSFATSNTIRKQFYHYLLPNEYVERISRGIYKITQKGEKLLEILNLNLKIEEPSEVHAVGSSPTPRTLIRVHYARFSYVSG